MNEPYDCTPPTVTLDELIDHLQSIRNESGSRPVVFLDEVMGFLIPVELGKFRVTGRNLSYVTHEWKGNDGEQK